MKNYEKNRKMGLTCTNGKLYNTEVCDVNYYLIVRLHAGEVKTDRFAGAE